MHCYWLFLIVLAAILDCHIKFIGYQIIQSFLRMVSLASQGIKPDIDTKTTCFGHVMTELWSILCYFNGLAAILKITTFRKLDCLRL